MQRLTLLEMERIVSDGVAQGANEAQTKSGASGSQPSFSVEFGPLGVVQRLAGHSLAMDMGEVARSAGPAGVVEELLTGRPELFGSLEPLSEMMVTDYGTDEHLVSLTMHQYHRGLIVFGSSLKVMMNNRLFITAIEASVVPKGSLPSGSEVPDNEMLQADLLGAANCELGWFHPALIQHSGSEAVFAVLARKCQEHEASGQPITVYRLADEGTVLHVEPAVDYHSQTDVYQYDLQNPVYLETQALCGSGTYPNCVFPGSSGSVKSLVSAYGMHLQSWFARDSWDNGQGITGACAGAPDPHRLLAISDWDEPCNAAWDNSICSVFISPQYGTYPDVIAHEFTHGIMRSEGIAAAVSDHALSMNEGIPDLFGQFFEYASTTPNVTDWISGGNPVCGSFRNLAEPHNSANANGFPIEYPEHASEYCMSPWDQCPDLPFGWGANYANSTLVGKLGHLLGRSPSLGAETHWGVAVAGIGMQAAASIFYRAMTAYMTNMTTFSALRDYLYLAAVDLYGSGSTEAAAVLSAVDAMGFWTSPVLSPSTSTARTEVVEFAVSGQPRRYWFGVSNGVIWYQYRTCPLNSPCQWTTPVSLFSCTTGLSVAAFGTALWVAFDYQGTAWTARLNSAGVWDYLGSVPRSSTTSRPELVVVNGVYLKVYIRDSGSLASALPVRVSVWSGTGWSNATSTAYTTRSPVDCTSSGWVSRCVYRNANNDVEYRAYNHYLGAYGVQVVPPLHVLYSGSTFEDVHGPAIARYRDRIHLAVNDRPMLFYNGVYYGSASASCEASSCWTRFSRIDGNSDNYDVNCDWVSLWAGDSFLYLFRQDTRFGAVFLRWRWKNSE